MESLIDYRNAKYQGQTNQQQLRNGFGILVDDDLSFYASHWQDGKLNDSTVIYISHGKYIYGIWHNNQPHGLNVFRIGDTVILGEFDNGYLIKKVIIIFQKLNFVAILEQVNSQWTVRQKGILKNYNQLVRYIELAKIPMKPQYFSLIKFLTYISNQKVSPTPCPGTENCYFGFNEGLGIVFNANNGVVTVGCHQNKTLNEFGGKYQLYSLSAQGNFMTNQIVRYSKQRPKQQIYSIFQKLHKRSLNFKNQYFDSKVKLLTHIQQLVRGKIDEIVNKKSANNEPNNFTAYDLNDSLDYHGQNLEQINKVNKIREQVYEQVHIPMKKAISQYVNASPKLTQKRSMPMTPIKKNPELITNAPVSPITKKTPLRSKQTEKKERQELQEQKSLSRTPTRRNIGLNNSKNEKYKVQQQEQQINQCKQISLFSRKQSQKVEMMPIAIKNSSFKKLQQPLSKSPYRLKYNNELNQQQFSPIQQILVSSKNYTRQKQPHNIPSFRYGQPQVDKISQSKIKGPLNETQINKIQGYQKIKSYQKVQKIQSINKVESIQKIQNVEWIQSSGAQSGSNIRPSILKSTNRTNQTTMSPIRTPNYENLSQRRKRLLKEFKNLNTSQNNPGSAISKLISTSILASRNPSFSPNISALNNIEQQKQNQAPKIVQPQSPCAQWKLPIYQSKNTERNENMFPLTMCKNRNQDFSSFSKSYGEREKQLKSSIKQKISSYKYENIQQINFKQNIDISKHSYDMRKVEKKQCYYQKSIIEMRQRTDINRFQNSPLTPTRKKVYKYCFQE